MTLCIPPDTDWGCAFTDAELDQMRQDAEKLRTMERSEAFAWHTLAALTAYRIGVCPIVVRPCAQRCAPQGTWMEAVVSSAGSLPTMTIGQTFSPRLENGVWLNSCGCGSGDPCGCGALSEIVLPGPVGDIVEIRIDGVPLLRNAYRVDNGNRLVRQDGESWPTCQDMSRPAGEPGTFTVEYYRGAAPNEITRYAAGVLATEFYKGCTDRNGKCRLPRGTVSVQRRGVSIELESDFMDSLATWPEIAPVVAMFNPYRLKTAPRVLSPDSRSTPRRQTWGLR